PYEIAGLGVGEEIWSQFSVQENPASAVEAVSSVVDLNCRRRQFVPFFCAPGERVQTSIDRSRRSIPVVKIRSAETNHRAEGAFPCKRTEPRHDIRIRLELQTFGAGRNLILVNHERSRESHAVIAKLPYAALTVCRPCKRPAAQHQQVSAATQKLVNVGPNLFRERGPVRKNEDTSLRGSEQGRQLLNGGKLSAGEQLPQLFRGGVRGIRRRKRSITKDYGRRRRLHGSEACRRKK